MAMLARNVGLIADGGSDIAIFRTLLDTTWKVILKALLRKAFKITYFSVLARKNGD